jgi:tRNA pseudouridine55 synthase
MDGVINIYKPEGITSFDVVWKIRKLAHTKKVGHTGTLDPEAAFVLPICIGK